MLGFIKGKVISKNADTSQCIVLAHRLGYEVTVPRHVFDTVEVDGAASLWLHTHVREDAFVLFGFATEAEKHFFRVLLSASGVGPKVALSLLTEHGPEKLIHFILQKDVDGIAEAPGVGKKLAQKLVLELSGKVEKLAWTDIAQKPLFTRVSPTTETASPAAQLREELASALQNLAFHPSQVKTVLDRMFEREETAKQSFEECLKAALKELSGRAAKGAEVSGRA